MGERLRERDVHIRGQNIRQPRRFDADNRRSGIAETSQRLFEPRTHILIKLFQKIAAEPSKTEVPSSGRGDVEGRRSNSASDGIDRRASLTFCASGPTWSRDMDNGTTPTCGDLAEAWVSARRPRTPMRECESIRPCRCRSTPNPFRRPRRRRIRRSNHRVSVPDREGCALARMPTHRWSCRGQLVKVGLADDDGPGIAQARHDDSVGSRDVSGPDARCGGRRNTLHVDEILEGNRAAVQRTSRPALPQFFVERPRLFHGLSLEDRDERVERRVELRRCARASSVTLFAIGSLVARRVRSFVMSTPSGASSFSSIGRSER